MSVRPDVMDGVPEERGWYFVNEGLEDFWQPRHLHVKDGEFGFSIGGYHFTDLEECKFSEKIEPPEGQ